jgi:hypothetical protein
LWRGGSVLADGVYDGCVRERLWSQRHDRSAGWQLVTDCALAYRAPNGFDGVCHLRVFESGARRERPVVIVGELSDQVGACSIVNACEWIAALVQDTLFADGRAFTYVEHHPETITGSPEPTFAIVHLERERNLRKHAPVPDSPKASSIVVVTEEGSESQAVPRTTAMPAWQWVFTQTSREPLAVHWLDGDHVELDVLPSVQVRVWPTVAYTAYAVAGEEGVLPSVRTAESNSERVAQLTGIVDLMNEIPADAILGTSIDPDDPEEHTDRKGRA